MEDLPNSDSDQGGENFTGTSDLEEPEVERRKLNAKLEFLDVMLQRIREEERLRRASGPPGNTLSYFMKEHQEDQCDGDGYKNLPNHVSNILPSDAFLDEHTRLLDNGEVKKHICIDSKVEVSMKLENSIGKDAVESSPTLTEVVSKPDLNSTKDHMLLDKLSIRELRDTFKATFGRETVVEDKQWLKRRISIALKKFSKKNGQEFMTSRHGKGSSEKIPTDSSHVQATESKMTSDKNDMEGIPISSLGNISLTTSLTDVFAKRDFGMPNYDVPFRAEIKRKRTRKPTRRYIEELSKTVARPNSGRLLNSLRHSDRGFSVATSCTKPDWNGFDRMTLVWREDSLGGYGIQIPFVLRVRKGRPRKNYGSLMKHKTSESLTSILKKSLHVQDEQCSSDNGDMKQIAPIESAQNSKHKTSESPTSILKNSLHVQEEQCSSDNGDMKQIVPFESAQNSVHDSKENNEKMLLSVPTDMQSVAETFNFDSIGMSGNYVTRIRTAKGGIRRKHHRSWTLQEVMKLVDGVSRFGVGRWSDIRKLVFSSSGYRTSVDLKDKWRNLLRASNAQLQTKKEVGNRKKHGSIPESILARVRELSVTQSLALCAPSSSNPVIRSGRIVHKSDPIQIKVECT